MKQYKRRPAVITAVQFDGENGEAIKRWANWGPYPIEIKLHPDGLSVLIVRGHTGPKEAMTGDWIIHAENGDWVVYNPDLFELTYEEVADG